MTTPTPTPTSSTTSSPLSAEPTGILGRYLWYDLMTPDPAAAVAFYSAVTGWTISEWAMGDNMPPYRMWVNSAGAPIGGSIGMPPSVAGGTPAHWIAYVGTPDMQATYTRALELGATSCVAPTAIPTVGMYAVLNDPHGATFALYMPENAASPEGDPMVGDMSWHELYSTDRAAAFAFYSELFRWAETSTMDMGPHGIYQMFGRGARTYGGMMNRMDEQVPPMWGVYIRVADIEAALAAVRANGGAVVNGPMPVPGGDIVAQCTDPHGGYFGIHEKPS